MIQTGADFVQGADREFSFFFYFWLVESTNCINTMYMYYFLSNSEVWSPVFSWMKILISSFRINDADALFQLCRKISHQNYKDKVMEKIQDKTRYHWKQFIIIIIILK